MNHMYIFLRFFILFKTFIMVYGLSVEKIKRFPQPADLMNK